VPTKNNAESHVYYIVSVDEKGNVSSPVRVAT